VARYITKLSVWDDTHTLPADALDVKGLRAAMTKTSDAQMAALAKDPAEYQAILKVALQAMVVDQMPATTDIEASDVKPGTTMTGTLSRKGAGERVPFAMVAPANWNGMVVIWVDAKGVAALGTKDQPSAEIKPVLASGAAVLAIDPFLSDSFKPAPAAAGRGGRGPAGMRDNYSGYVNGYERSPIANRAHDLLTAIAYAKSVAGTKSIRIVGTDGAGIQALLATALAGDAVEKAAIDLGNFDFVNVKENSDPNLLPGALKYGNVPAFAWLAARSAKVHVTHVSATTPIAVAGNLSLAPNDNPGELAAWVLSR
jgi:hypothetical protein